jgi:hypothetical protein
MAGRRIPSFFIRNCRVERFMPSRFAAPFGPAKHPLRLLDGCQDVRAFSILQRAG